MGRIKIDYGIDLGTTNSAIARMDNGEVKIFRSDAFQKDTTPSCVSFRMGTIFVGDKANGLYTNEQLVAFNDFSRTGNKDHKFNTFREFKRTMGTDEQYESASAGRSFDSDELSAEVLMALKAIVRDEEISSVVITVPARFRNNQIDATQAAAELAGFNYCELLQEPIAASIAYGVSSKSVDGYWLVFDFGGGTFDVALMKVEEGIMKVVDTGGDPQLGGKDVDFAVADKVIIPHLAGTYNIANILKDDYGKHRLREALKFMAEEAKIAISPPSKSSVDMFSDKPLGEDDDGETIEVEFKMTLPQFEEAVAPIYQRAIDLSLKLLKKNHLKPSDLEMVLPVGGPTLSQTLRKMLSEQFDTKIDTSIDPMTAVAVGAALSASSKDVPISLQTRDRQKIQLILKYPANTVETDENLGLKIDQNQTSGEIPDKIFAEINRNDKGWSSGRVEIIDGAEIISLLLQEGKSNGFEVTLFDEKGTRLSCEPPNFSIIQGFNPPNATLPYDLCIEAFSNDNLIPLLSNLEGLLKNQSIPVKGKGIYRTLKDLRPGNANDRIRIPIFEGEPDTRAIHNWPAGIVTISGDDLPKFLPKGSDVVISLDVDASRRITITAFFPDIDETVERKIERNDQSEFDADDLQRDIEMSDALLSKLEGESTSIDLAEAKAMRTELQELAEILENGKSDSDTKRKVKERLRDAAKELDKIADDDQFPKAEEALLNSLSELRVTNERFGNDQTTELVEEFEKLSKEAIRRMNIRAVKELISQVDSLDFHLFDEGAGVAFELGFIKRADDDFETIGWTKRSSARQLIDQAKEIISNDPSKQKLRPIVQQIFKLMPEPEREKLSDGDDEYLEKIA